MDSIDELWIEVRWNYKFDKFQSNSQKVSWIANTVLDLEISASIHIFGRIQMGRESGSGGMWS